MLVCEKCGPLTQQNTVVIIKNSHLFSAFCVWQTPAQYLSTRHVHFYTIQFAFEVERCTLLCPWFSEQEYCSGLPCPPPGDILRGSSRPRDQFCVSCVPSDAGSFFTTGATWEVISMWMEKCYTFKGQSLENGLSCIFQATGKFFNL